MQKIPIFLNPPGMEQGIFHCQHLLDLDIILPRWFSFQAILQSCTPFSVHYLHFISSLCFPVASAAHISSSTKNICSRTFLCMCLVCTLLWARTPCFRSCKFFPSFCTIKEFLKFIPFQMKNTCSSNRILANCASTGKIAAMGYLVILKWVLYEHLLPIFQQLLSTLSSERMRKKRLSFTWKL